MFNMEVADTHDFAVNGGVIVHNCYDELRYVCMKNPVPAPVVKTEAPRPYNPLDTDDRPDKYEWWRKY